MLALETVSSRSFSLSAMCVGSLSVDQQRHTRKVGPNREAVLNRRRESVLFVVVRRDIKQRERKRQTLFTFSRSTLFQLPLLCVSLISYHLENRITPANDVIDQLREKTFFCFLFSSLLLSFFFYYFFFFSGVLKEVKFKLSSANILRQENLQRH